MSQLLRFSVITSLLLLTPPLVAEVTTIEPIADTCLSEFTEDYNCDNTTWADGDMLSRSNRYVARKTDFRSIFGEIFTNHFGTPADRLEAVMPGFHAARTANPNDFIPLGIA